MPSVLFVCTGNLYRSPLAAAYFEQLLLDGRFAGWRVESAGTWVVSQQRVPEPVHRYGKLLGLDLAAHLTRPVDRELMCESELVLVMEHGQKEALAAEFPDLKERVYLLTEFLDGAPFDIPDPVGAPDQSDEIFRDMLNVIDRGFPRIVALAELRERSGG
jgi:protein-tyrosine-phosphatase